MTDPDKRSEIDKLINETRSEIAYLEFNGNKEAIRELYYQRMEEAYEMGIKRGRKEVDADFVDDDWDKFEVLEN